MAVQSSKELIRGLFQFKELPRAPFVPWICGYAARLDQVPLQDMLSDAGLLSRTLINTQKLFDYDAIANVFDSTLEAEACGCETDWGSGDDQPRITSHPLADGANIEDLDSSNIEKKGRIPIILEATKRLVLVRGKEVAVIGVVTGPLTLARHLIGEAFSTGLEQNLQDAQKIIGLTAGIGLKLSKAYCELGVDMIAITEEMLGQLSPTQYQVLTGPLKSIWNVARYYNVRSLIISRGCRAEQVEPALALQADGVALSGKFDDRLLTEAAFKRKAVYSRSLPDSAFLGNQAQSSQAAREYVLNLGKGCFLSTGWEVPLETDVNNLHEIMTVLRDDPDS